MFLIFSQKPYLKEIETINWEKNLEKSSEVFDWMFGSIIKTFKFKLCDVVYVHEKLLFIYVMVKNKPHFFSSGIMSLSLGTLCSIYVYFVLISSYLKTFGFCPYWKWVVRWFTFETNFEYFKGNFNHSKIWDLC